jgi:hypothetical protein
MGLSASFKTVWAREMQEVTWVTNVWRPQANFRLESELKDGDKIKRMIPSKMVPQDYTHYTDLTPQQATTTGEELTVDKTPTIPFVISDLDELQSTPKSRKTFTDMAVEQMNNIINGWYTAEVANAGSTIDAANFGGTAGEGAVITPANVKKMFSIAQRNLGRKNIYNFKPGESKYFANIGPDIYQALVESLGDRESALGDKLVENGHAGRYGIFDLYVHNAGYWTGDLYLPVNPTDGDTMVLQVSDQTITITFKSTVAAAAANTAGQVKIASTVDLTRANLATFLNAPGTSVADATNAGYNALSSDQQAILYGSTWTNNNTTDKLTVTWRGVGSPIVSETFTSASNIFTTGKNIAHNMFGQKGAVDFVVQRAPKIQIDPDPDRIEEWIIKPYSLFGRKTYSDGARKLVNVKVDTTSYV